MSSATGDADPSRTKTEIGLDVFGQAFGISSQDEEIAAELTRLLKDLPVSTGHSASRVTISIAGDRERGFSISQDGVAQATDLMIQDVAPLVVSTLNRLVIETMPGFAVHSGVVALRESIMALPAESGGGKTTLVAAMLSSGARYLSDEALVFDDAGNVLPYPKPLAMSPWSAAALGLGSFAGERLFTATDLGAEVGRPGRLTHLVIPTYGSEPLEISPLPRSQAVATLLELAFNHYRDPARAFRIATEVARGLNVWKLSYDDPMGAVEAIDAAIG